MGQIFPGEVFCLFFAPHSSHPALFYQGAPASGIFHQPLRPLQRELIPLKLASRLHLGESRRPFVSKCVPIEFQAPILRANRSLCASCWGSLPAGWAIGKWFTNPGPTIWEPERSLKIMVRKLETGKRPAVMITERNRSYTHNDFNFAKIKGVGVWGGSFSNLVW